jgi:hypothetical protein
MPTRPSLSAAQLRRARRGEQVDVACVLTAQRAPGLLEAVVADPRPPTPLTTFRRTTQPLRVHCDEATEVVMGRREQLRPGALVFVRGLVRERGVLHAQVLAILAGRARID